MNMWSFIRVSKYTKTHCSQLVLRNKIHGSMLPTEISNWQNKSKLLIKDTTLSTPHQRAESLDGEVRQDRDKRQLSFCFILVHRTPLRTDLSCVWCIWNLESWVQQCPVSKSQPSVDLKFPDQDCFGLWTSDPYAVKLGSYPVRECSKCI